MNIQTYIGNKKFVHTTFEKFWRLRQKELYDSFGLIYMETGIDLTEGVEDYKKDVPRYDFEERDCK